MTVEEVVLYKPSNLIADIGGYLGLLLLGESILSVIEYIFEMSTRFKV